MKKCTTCKKYTLKNDCYECKTITIDVSNKYYPADKYFILKKKEYLKQIKEKI